MPRVGFEPTISAGERPKTYALDRANINININAVNVTIVSLTRAFSDLASKLKLKLA